MRNHLLFVDFYDTLKHLGYREEFYCESYIESYFNMMKASYQTSNRYYHNDKHILNMLNKLDSDRSKYNITELDFYTIRLAIYFHDLFYNITYTDGRNEDISADMLIEFGINIKLNANLCDRISVLIFSTYPGEYLLNKDLSNFVDDSSAEPNYLIKLIRDLDLQTFGLKDYDEFREVQSDIRMENLRMDDEAYCRGTKMLLESVLNKPKIFGTEEYASLEGYARRNITERLKEINDELEVLGKGI